MVETSDSSQPSSPYLNLAPEELEQIAKDTCREVRIAGIEAARISRQLNKAAEDRANRGIGE